MASILFAAVVLGHGAQAADPERGAMLYAQSPRPGLLACIDCHGDNPTTNNFGNIWSGRNAVALIQRAVAFNTGGMGVFAGLYTADDLADIAAWLGNTPARLQFPLTAQGASSAPQTVTMRSSTKAGIENLGIGVEGDFAVAGGDCGTAVPRFDSCSLQLVFRPTAGGQRTGALVIAHDGTPTPIRIPLSGEGDARPPAVARVVPARLDAGIVGVGDSASPQAVSLVNDSDQPLRIAGLETSSPAWRLAGGDCAAGRVLAGGERCVAAVRFVPGAAGDATARLTIRHDGQGGASRVELAGRGAATTLPRLRAEPAALVLAGAEPGQRGAMQTVVVQHAGAARWTGGRVRTTDPAFEVVADRCSGASLPTGGHCEISLALRPSWDVPRSGELRLETSDGQVALRVPLSADGLGAAAAPAVVPSRISLTATVGSTRLAGVQFVARGAAASALARWEIEAQGSNAWSLAGGDSCAAGQPLAPGSGCTIAVAFAPSTAGAHEARLRLEGADGRTRMVPLSGRAREATRGEPWLDAERLDFGAVAPGATATRSLTVHNRGDAPWQPLAPRVDGDDAEAFRVGGTCIAGTPLPAGASCRVDVRMSPTAAAGELRATLRLPAAGDDGASPLVTLGGQALAGAGASLVVDRPRVEWPARAPDSAGAPQRVVVRNAGSRTTPSAPVIDIDGPFAVSRQSAACAAPLAPQARCELELIARPAAGDGVQQGRLRVASGTLRTQADLVAVVAQNVAELRWQVEPAATGLAATAIGDRVAGPWWTLVNAGRIASGPLRLAIGGHAAADYSLDPDGSCRPGQGLAAGAACRLRLVFHPSQPGARDATLVASDGAAALQATVAARGLAPPVLLLAAAPASLHLIVRPDGTAVPQTAWLRATGPSALAVDSLALQGAGFERVGSTADVDECPDAPFALLPGDGCRFAVRWTGTADGRFGATLAASAEGSAAAVQVPVTLAEDPAGRRNEGAGGGAAHPGWLLALLVAIGALWHTRRDAGSDKMKR